jgi:hypothetical protein
MTHLEAIRALLEKMDRSNTESLHQTPALSTELSSLESMMSQVSLAEDKASREHAILRSLSFESRTARYMAIPEAHRETFHWVFQSEEAIEKAPGPLSKSKGQLHSWLKQGDGVFWVSGKPGSGKSTFMKFVADHPATKTALLQWAGSHRLLLASYYFWNAGTTMQKSQQGLLQTLLYEILRCCPDLMPTIFEGRWKSEHSSIQQPWSLSELRSATRSLSLENRQGYKFCFFLDGLDEFQGEHIDFCEDLMSLLSATNIKLCVSSRPWNVFEDAFGCSDEHKLYIHEVTRPDIFRYAQDRLRWHPRWRLINTRSNRTLSLIESITEKSRGVFLWVFIVTNLLREGLTNDDSFSDLERRLVDFPADLEAFFKQILESVPEFYHQKMAGTLRLALAAKEPLDAIIYSFHDEEYDDRDFAVKFFCHEPDEQLNNARRQQVVRRLNGRCRGLLEESMGRIDFLHRTVVDFLRTPDMSEFLRARTAPWLEENFSIFKASIASFKATGIEAEEIRSNDPSSTPLDTLLARRIEVALGYAARAESSKVVPDQALYSVIEELDDSITGMLAARINEEVGQLGWDFEALDQLTQLCRMVMLRRPLSRYLSAKLEEQPSYLAHFNPPALSLVVRPWFYGEADWLRKCTDMMEILFKHNYNPNTKLGLNPLSMTIWERFFSDRISAVSATKLVAMGSNFVEVLASGIFARLLRNGADPNIRLRMCCEKCPGCPAVLAWLLLAFEIPADAGHQGPYLATLELFFKHGAKLGRVPLIEGSMLQEAICDHKSPQETFLERLQQTFMGKHDTQFLRSVVMRIMTHVMLAGWSSDQLTTTMLPQSNIQPVRAHVGFIQYLKDEDEKTIDPAMIHEWPATSDMATRGLRKRSLSVESENGGVSGKRWKDNLEMPDWTTQPMRE